MHLEYQTREATNTVTFLASTVAASKKLSLGTKDKRWDSRFALQLSQVLSKILIRFFFPKCKTKLRHKRMQLNFEK